MCIILSVRAAEQITPVYRTIIFAYLMQTVFVVVVFPFCCHTTCPTLNLILLEH